MPGITIIVLIIFCASAIESDLCFEARKLKYGTCIGDNCSALIEKSIQTLKNGRHLHLNKQIKY